LGGAIVYSLAIDPSTPATVYVGTYGGEVFKSTDGGGSWSAVSAGLGGAIVYSLAIDPSTPATVYAGTQGGGVFKTTNGGGSWSAVNTGLGGATVYSLAIDPSSPATVYAGTYGGGGVFESIDGGGSWSAVSTGLGAANVNSLAIDPGTPATIYAGTDGSGVFSLTGSTPREYALTTIITGGGTINNVQQGTPSFACAGSGTVAYGCVGYFPAGTAFTLHATPSALFDFAGWSGGGCGTGDCQLVLTTDTTVTAIFIPQPLVQLVGTTTPFQSLATAYGAASGGAVLRARDAVLSEDVHLNKPIDVTLKGGYAAGFTTVSGLTTLRGILSLELGSMIVDNLVVQ
jgi:hypothetical protein